MNSEEHRDLRDRLERLPDQIREYYDIYFSELRRQLSRPDLFFEAIPNVLKGYKRVISIGGKNGLVVAHFPIELEITVSETNTGRVLIHFPPVSDAVGDTFEFITSPDSPVRDLASIISGEEAIGAGISTEERWGPGAAGVLDKPVQKFDSETGQLVWQAPWTRLVYADFNHLHYWEDTERAKREAREDVKPYLRGLKRKELDEIRAPEAIEEAGIKAGDRGVVLEVFERPSPTLLVEYADFLGQTKALVTYSKDLETILDVFVDRDFSANREGVLDRGETVRQQTFDFSPHSPVIEGRLVTA
jgi:hypothetical protein